MCKKFCERNRFSVNRGCAALPENDAKLTLIYLREHCKRSFLCWKNKQIPVDLVILQMVFQSFYALLIGTEKL